MKYLLLIALWSSFTFANNMSEIKSEIKEPTIKIEKLIGAYLVSITRTPCFRYCADIYNLNIEHNNNNIKIRLPYKFDNHCLLKLTAKTDNIYVLENKYNLDVYKYMNSEYHIDYYVQDSSYADLLMILCW